MSCNKCFQSTCYCQPVVSNTIVNSDVAGREGLSAKSILIQAGKLPVNATDQQFTDYIKGEPGKDGADGQQQYKNTEW